MFVAYPLSLVYALQLINKKLLLCIRYFNIPLYIGPNRKFSSFHSELKTGIPNACFTLLSPVAKYGGIAKFFVQNVNDM